jgi:phosphoglucosamine mutase
MLKYFGTDGVRGLANEDLTAAMAYRIGRCLGQYPLKKKNRILVCRDTRASGEMLSAALVCGLLASGAEVYDEGISTTPSVSYLVIAEKFDFGVMISASHNPFADNGIKIFNNEGEKLEEAIEKGIEEYMDKAADDLPLFSGEAIGRFHDGDFLKKKYLAWLVGKKEGDYQKLHVLVDCANGSASSIAPKLYKELGLDCVFINDKPDGLNINKGCGSTHLKSLEERFAKGHFDLGFAFDGDSDRFMALSQEGRVIDGDAMIFLNALSLSKKKKLHHGKVVLTVMSNLGLLKALKSHKIGYVTVLVGDKNVQMELKKEGLSLGGEQSGHIIFLDDLKTGDGLLSSIKFLNLFVNDKETYKALKDFVVYPQVLENVPFPSRDKLEQIAASARLGAIVEKEKSLLKGNGRLLVRVSGTEPLLRVMAEAGDETKAHQVVSDIVEFAKKEA